jgi:hypothetical protein
MSIAHIIASAGSVALIAAAAASIAHELARTITPFSRGDI